MDDVAGEVTNDVFAQSGGSFGDVTSDVLRLSPCVGYSVAHNSLQSLNDHSRCSHFSLYRSLQLLTFLVRFLGLL